jgi:hypothetical protein
MNPTLRVPPDSLALLHRNIGGILIAGLWGRS